MHVCQQVVQPTTHARCGPRRGPRHLSRRIQVLGSTPDPDEAFVVQTMRHLTDDVDGLLRGDRLLICDRD